MFDPPIKTRGTVINSPKAGIYRLSLPNGKNIIGHVPRSMKHLHEQLGIAKQVSVELTAYDLEKGRIIGVIDSVTE